MSSAKQTKARRMMARNGGGKNSQSAAAESLRKWINDGANSHARETILMHRLCHDLQLAAARRGYYLNTYFDDVDHDGFDVIYDDRDTLKKMQVKSVFSASDTQQWNIRKGMLRPPFELIERIGYEPSASGEGNGGGVILQEFDVSADGRVLEVRYLYTDVFVIEAFRHGVVSRSDGRSRKAVDEFLKRMTEGVGSDTVTVPRAMFLRARGTDELLALAGLHSRSDSGWKHQVIVIANNSAPHTDRKLEIPGGLTLAKYKTICADEIRTLSDEDGITMVKP